VRGANYVPSYSVNDVKDVFRPGFWNATTVTRELSWAARANINSLRVFMGVGDYAVSPPEVLANYKEFLQIAKAANLTVLVTLGTGERSPNPATCDATTEFVNAVVGAELAGTVICYEADNEPTQGVIGFLINCTLPALQAAVSGDVDISVGVAHVGEVDIVKKHVTTLNWHSYNGKDNGGGFYSEIHYVSKYLNRFDTPKAMVLTEYHGRPAQPLAMALPVLREANRQLPGGVAGYLWALVIVDCTTHWNRPVGEGDPPFQGLFWPNGTAWDDVEEIPALNGENITYAQHAHNGWPDNRLDAVWNFSAGWAEKVFGSPTFKLPGPREGTMRWTNTSGASVSLEIPPGTKRVALYLPKTDRGADYSISLDGKNIATGTTNGAKEWVHRTVLPVEGGKSLELVVGKTDNTTQFAVNGATFFAS